MKYVAVLLCVFVVMVASLAFAPASIAQVRLNEILADPGTDWNGDGTVDSKLDEWVEIANIGSAAIDLTRYRISDASAGASFRFALSGSLAPGEVKVYYGSDAVAWQAANGVSQLGFSLNNAGDTVTLYEVDGAEVETADSRIYAAAEVLDDRANGRMPSGSGDWVIFDALNPYKGPQPPVATGCAPSPGSTTACPNPTEASTWGRVKSLYRS